jgi:hypothetical protein
MCVFYPTSHKKQIAMQLQPSDYHSPTWMSVQIRMIPMGHWRHNDAIPRLAYHRIHRYVHWILAHHKTTGLNIDTCLLMHPTESLLWFDTGRWFRPLPRPTCPLDDPGQECLHRETFDDPNSLFGMMQDVPIHIRALIDHLDPSKTTVVSERTVYTIGQIVDMILIDAAYSVFVPETLATIAAM